jgi:hypothetical protein
MQVFFEFFLNFLNFPVFISCRSKKMSRFLDTVVRMSQKEQGGWRVSAPLVNNWVDYQPASGPLNVPVALVQSKLS